LTKDGNVEEDGRTLQTRVDVTSNFQFSAEDPDGDVVTFSLETIKSIHGITINNGKFRKKTIFLLLAIPGKFGEASPSGNPAPLHETVPGRSATSWFYYIFGLVWLRLCV